MRLDVPDAQDDAMLDFSYPSYHFTGDRQEFVSLHALLLAYSRIFQINVGYHLRGI